jgi:beta-lactam-binding protein with PASTA domain
MVTIPDVVGLTYSRAQKLLAGAGFTVKGKHTGSGKTVTGTDPSGEASTGSEITVDYGSAKVK